MREQTNAITKRVAESIVRDLRHKGFGATPVNMSGNDNDWDIEKICVTKRGRDLCDINCQTGTILYLNSFDRNTINDILEIVKSIKWEDEVYSKAPNMEIEGLRKYKLLSQYNNVILAACEVSTLDYNNQKVHQFDYVTWEKDKAVEGVHAGNYFGKNYASAREDFAQRSGLINKDKLFSETEMLTIYSGLVQLQEFHDISWDKGKVIDLIKNKISNVLPDINEKIFQASPKYEENEKYQRKNNSLERDEDILNENEYDQEI
jgi:hypothetical protein